MSNQSATIAALAAALAKAQGEIVGAVKDSENPFFNKSYADLASVWDACRTPLSKNGLAVIQTTESAAEGMLVIVTTLAHSSGEWVQGKLSLRPAKSDPQGIGSAITYGRRYSLAAIVGVAQVDDDGESAQRRPPASIEPKQAPAPQPRPPIQSTRQDSGSECTHEWAQSRFKEDEEYCTRKCGTKRKKAA